MAKRCPRCDIVNSASATRCDCGADLNIAPAPRDPFAEWMSVLGYIGPLLLVFGIVSMCGDCALNNDFAAYDSRRETLLSWLGALLVLCAPVTGLAALVLDRSRKQRMLPGLSRMSYFLNAVFVVVAVLYAMRVAGWALSKC